MKRLGLALLLSLVAVLASTGIALQHYLMVVQNPALKGDLCTAQTKEVEHSPLCAVQLAPGQAPLEAPEAPRPLGLLPLRVGEVLGVPLELGEALLGRAPPFPLD